MLSRAAVVVPAHNEERLIGACLDALVAARSAVGVPLDIIVVLDACDDRTADRARRRGVRTVVVEARNVGLARAAGVAEALATGAGWVASTDADSRVPVDWLAHHLRLARAGADVVAGTVRVDAWHGWPPGLAAIYGARYAAEERPVHGANLSLSAAAYAAVGGFPAVALSEDRHLVRAARSAGLRVVHTTGSPVVTSARRHARAPGGFSGHLATLAAANTADRARLLADQPYPRG